MNRFILLFLSKLKSMFQKNIAFSSRVEYSDVSPKAKVWGHCKVFHSTIDDYSYIGAHCRVIHAHIGKFCSIAGDYSQIGMGTHSMEYLLLPYLLQKEMVQVLSGRVLRNLKNSAIYILEMTSGLGLR